MADGVIQLVARLGNVSAMPEDVFENVINVGLEDGSYSAPDVDPMMEALRDFYIVQAGGASNQVADYISENVSRVASACTIQAYYGVDLTGATPFGSPIDSLSFTMTASAGGTPFPEEVATVLSYNADLTDVPVSEPNPSPPPAIIRPAQRMRGRMFVGPLNTNSQTDSGTIVRPSSTYRTDVTQAFKELAETINAIDANYFLGIWSRADANVWEAVEGWMDDAWDTQRRRGGIASARTTFTIT